MNTTTVGDALRQRLQLTLGREVEFGDEIPSVSGRAFAGINRDSGQAVVVTVHRAASDFEALHRRLQRLRQLDHGVLDIPIADGGLDGRAWVMELVSTLPSAADRLDSGPVLVALAVAALRDLARGVAAIHRLDIAHGAIALRTVRISESGARLGGCGENLGGSVRGDLDALGVVAWALLSGEIEQSPARPLSSLRRGVPPALDALCASFCARNPGDRPQRAEAILDALDAIPTRRRNPLTSIVDAGWRDGRSRRTAGWLLAGAAIAALAVLLALRI